MEDNGKYIIDGKEIEIDYNEDIPLEVLNGLRDQPVSALDMFYVRKHLHQFSNWAADLTVNVDDKIIAMEEKIEEFMKTEFICKNETIPNIAKTVAETAVKKIVNGSLTEMNTKLQALIVDGKEVHKRFDVFNKDLFDKIEEVGAKTIYGWLVKNFKQHFIRSSIVAILLTGFLFSFMMAVLHVTNFSDLIFKIWNFFK